MRWSRRSSTKRLRRTLHKVVTGVAGTVASHRSKDWCEGYADALRRLGVEAEVVSELPSVTIELDMGLLRRRWSQAMIASNFDPNRYPWTGQLARAFRVGSERWGEGIVEMVFEKVQWARSNPVSYAITILLEGDRTGSLSKSSSRSGPPRTSKGQANELVHSLLKGHRNENE